MILFIVTVLANALWQPALIALVAWAVLKLSRCANATTHHAVWILALIASLAAPMMSALPASQTDVQTIRTASPSVPSAQQFRTLPQPQPARKIASASQAPAGMSMLSIARPQLSLHPTVAMVIIAMWLTVMLAILVRLCVSILYLERLKHNSLPLPIDARHALTRWEHADRGSRNVRICVSEEISIPVAVGIFDSMILLPSDFVRELDPSDVDRIILHELAHIRRSDDWINLFERTVQALLFFSPGIYWISRQLDLEREVACDDWVLEQSDENVPYARCLARIAEMTRWPHAALAAPGIFVTRKSISIRIERLLARGRDVRIRIALAPSLFATIALIIIMAGGGFLSPTIAYTIDTDASIPVQVMRTSVSPVHVAARPAAKLQTTTTPPQTSAVLNPSPPPSGGYLDDLASAGLRNLEAEDIMAFKSLGIDGEYVRSMQRYFGTLGPHELSSLKALGVNEVYLDGLRSRGLVGFSAHEVCSLKALSVTADYIESLAAVGYPHLSATEYGQLKALGVDAGFIRGLRDHGYTNLSVWKIMQFKALGIQP